MESNNELNAIYICATVIVVHIFMLYEKSYYKCMHQLKIMYFKNAITDWHMLVPVLGAKTMLSEFNVHF